MSTIVFPPDVVASLPPLRRWGSPLAVNLARRTTPGVSRLRATVEEWIQHIPEQARPNLIGRLRDRNDRNHLAALYELLLYAHFRTRGYRVNMNEPIGPGDADLLVQNGCQFLVEVATVFPEAPEERRYNHLNSIVAAIDELRDDTYIAIIDANYGWPPEDLRPAAAKRAVGAYLQGIRRGDTSPDAGVKFGPVRIVLKEGKLPEGFVGLVDFPVEWHGTPEQVRSAVQKKVQKFRAVKGVSLPFLVALCDGGLHQNFHNAVDWVLFGRPALEIHRRGDGASSREIRTPEGFFGVRGRSTRLGAVIGCSYALSSRSVKLELQAWHNPRASVPLAPNCLSPLPQLVLAENKSGRPALEWTGKRGQPVPVRTTIRSPS